MILRKKISLEELIENSQNNFPNMIKFCIDKMARKVSIDEEMHYDMEIELYDDGSDIRDIFGGNIYFEDTSFEKIVWEAHPNIARNKELKTGRGRLLTDEAIIADLSDILTEWITMR